MKGTRTYREWADFGEDGAKTYEVRLDYRENRDYELSHVLENKVTEFWVDSLGGGEDKYTRLRNGRLLNLREVEDVRSENHEETMVCLGPTCFRDYHVMERCLNGSDGGNDISKQELETLQREVHPLSTFPAVVTQDDKMVMGKKSQETLDVGAGLVSFPGAGYLDRRKDRFTFEGADFTKKPGQLVSREMEEEMDVEGNEIKNMTFAGLWEDAFEGSHWNPALFSVVDVELSGDEIKERKGVAEDAWETEGPYILAPADEPRVLNEFVRSTFRGRKVDEEVRGEVEGLGEIKEIHGTGKAEMMFLQAGRHQFGQDWYEEKLDELGDVVEIRGEG